MSSSQSPNNNHSQIDISYDNPLANCCNQAHQSHQVASAQSSSLLATNSNSARSTSTSSSLAPAPPLPQPSSSILAAEGPSHHYHNRNLDQNSLPTPLSSSSLSVQMAAHHHHHYHQTHGHHVATLSNSSTNDHSSSWNHSEATNNQHQLSNTASTSNRSRPNHHHYHHHHHHHHHNQNIVYVYELPYDIRKSICDLLDADNSWRELGGRFMGFNDTQLTLISHALYRSASPTNELLIKWESSNAKVSHLFLYLDQMKHHRAMYYLLPFVNDKLRKMYESACNGHECDLNATNRPLLMTSAGTNEASFRNHSHPNALSNMSSPKHSADIQHSTLKSLIDKHELDKNSENDHHSDDTLIDLQNNHQQTDFLNVKRAKNNSQYLQTQEINYLLKIDDFKISYKELLIATNDFCKDNVLGSGGFGTVFIGDWKGTKVAIKKLKGLDNLTQALTELRILNCCRIDNILPLYAVSLDGPEPCLVYQYMPNGSLEDRLLCKNNSPPLTWIQRANIGEGVARALNFLHTLKGNPFVHGDVKSANILLDQLFEAKLGDFGLARQVVKNSRNENSIYTHCTVSSVNGTSVYLPTEYLRQKILSPAVDVYSYGIVILEMATGRRAYDGKKLLINLVEDEYNKAQQIQKANSHTKTHNQEYSLECLMDKRIADLTEGRRLFNYLLELGRRCAHKTKSKRPLMLQVLQYFNQCRATDRIHQLCDKMLISKNNFSRTNIKNPIELQLWYDFVRKSCGTLSEVVFENFGAQVTKIIEDLVSNCSNRDESTLCLDVLLSSKNRSSFANHKTSKEIILNKQHQSQTSSNELNDQITQTMVGKHEHDSLNNNSAENLTQLMKLINLDKSMTSLSSTSTLSTTSLCHLSPANNEDESYSTSTSFSNINNEQHSTPFIPLLTALGFNASDFDNIIIEQQNHP